MKRSTLLLICLFGLSSCECDDPEPELQIDESILVQRLGDPMPKATPEQLETFERGREVALTRFSPSDGLGPNYNVSFCAACHEQPVIGGSAPRYRDFLLVGNRLSDGSYVGLGTNGVLSQFSTQRPLREPTPEGANAFAGRSSIPFFGVGALAAINEDAILANIDEDDADGDGISGRANYDRGFVGRFGRKAQTVSIEGFIRGPLFNHLGVTTNPLSDEMKAKLPVPSVADLTQLRDGALFCINCQAAAPDEPNFDTDDTPDPEMSEQQLFDLVSFAMLMGAPAPVTQQKRTAGSIAGEERFREAKCTSCHVPALEGPDGLVPAYSDLLLHDMGEDLADGVEMGVATGQEFRTQPLWGISASGPYLHDGRADTLDEAIRMHGGEADRSRQAYEAMSTTQQQNLQMFLLSLGGAEQVSKGLIEPGSPTPETGDWGGPSSDLSSEDLTRFQDGRKKFDQNSLISDGLGLTQRFNGDSCRACHFDPVVGGSGPIGLNVMRHGTIETDMSFTAPSIGTILHRLSLDQTRPESGGANVFELRQTPPLFGLGLVDRIEDSTLQALEDPDDSDQDGISGRAHILQDGRVGKFGWKAQLPTLEDFVRDAVSNEVGLTLQEGTSHVAGVGTDEDGAADPEFVSPDYDDLVFFSQNLGRPPTTPIGGEGAQLFEQVMCSKCHVPSLTNADGVEVPLFSDLLLHDVAPADYFGIEDGQATMREFRTPPLWGIAESGPYMHDGFSPTIDHAIRRHASEAAASTSAYEALSEEDRELLLDYVRSL